MQRKGLANEQETLASLNDYLKGHSLRPMVRNASWHSIRAMIEDEGDAENLGNVWLFDLLQFWRWKEYIAKRQVLISLGVDGWHSKRPYSSADVYALVDDGVFDGEIDHPLFEVVQAG